MEQELIEKQKILQRIEKNLDELRYIKNALKDISQLKKEKALVPLANGIFVNANIEFDGNFYINVGEGVIVKKDLQNTNNLLEKQEKEMIKAKNSTLLEIEGLQKNV